MSNPSSTSQKKKKKRKKISILNIGDTVKLSKGRIGLVRFIGKTQFGLGEWIGIELYNELIKTRHNGAVLGKRYFRCPAYRGVFTRKQLIKLNIPVLDIDKSIKKLREKEKKLKDLRKKQLKKDKAQKKNQNVSKKQAKQLKLKEKYGDNYKQKMLQKKELKKKKNKKKKKKKDDVQTPKRKFKVKNGKIIKKNDKNDNKQKDKPVVDPKIASKVDVDDIVSSTFFSMDDDKMINKMDKVDDKITTTTNTTTTTQDDIMEPVVGAIQVPPAIDADIVMLDNDNDNDDDDDDSDSDAPSPATSPKPPPATLIEKKIIKQNSYKAKVFNSKFKDELEIRNSQNSLQLLFQRQKSLREQEKAKKAIKDKKDKRNSGTSDVSDLPSPLPSPVSSHVGSIKISTPVIDDDDDKVDTTPIPDDNMDDNTPVPDDNDIKDVKDDVVVSNDNVVDVTTKRKQRLSDVSKLRPKLSSHKSKTLVVDAPADDDPDIDADYDWDAQKIDVWKKEKSNSDTLRALNQINATKTVSTTIKTPDIDNIPLNEPILNTVDSGVISIKSKVSIDDDDGVLDSDDDSLNDSELDDPDQNDDEKALEDDFEENWSKHELVLDAYTHSISDFENARKKLAMHVVDFAKKQKQALLSPPQPSYNPHSTSYISDDVAIGMNKLSSDQSTTHQDKKAFKRQKYNPILALSLSKSSSKSKKSFNSARSRRASTFVDDYNVVDTLFFDGDEDQNAVNNADKFYVDAMESDDDDDDDMDDDMDDMDDNDDDDQSVSVSVSVSVSASQTNDIDKHTSIPFTANTIIEEEDDDDDVFDADDDPLMGRIEDILSDSLHDSEDEPEESDDDNDDNDDNDDDDNDNDNDNDDDDDDDDEQIKIFDVLKDSRLIKIITFYVELSEFLIWDSDVDGYGMLIKKIHKNDYGKALYVETGVESSGNGATGWCITNIDDNNVEKSWKIYITKLLQTANDNIPNKGYTLTFQKRIKQDNNSIVTDQDNLKPSIYIKSRSKKNLHKI